MLKRTIDGQGSCGSLLEAERLMPAAAEAAGGCSFGGTVTLEAGLRCQLGSDCRAFASDGVAIEPLGAGRRRVWFKAGRSVGRGFDVLSDKSVLTNYIVCKRIRIWMRSQ